MNLLKIFLTLSVILQISLGFGQSLNTNFATNGYAQDETSVGKGKEIAIQTDNKILVANQRKAVYINDNGVPDHYLYCMRYNENGSLDTSFGQDGVGTVPSHSEAEVYTLDIQSNGKILLGGNAKYCGNIICGFPNLSLGRLNTDGSVDTTFGNSGYLEAEDLIGPMHLSSKIQAVKALSSGKILISGYATISTDGTTSNFISKTFVARLNDDGSFDTSFGPSGTGMYEADQGASLEGEMLVADDGSIFWLTASNSQTVVLKLTSNGLLDSSFGNGGAHAIDVETNNNYFVSMDLRDDDKLVIGGYMYENSEYSSLVVILNSDGSMYSEASNSTIDIPMNNGRINTVKCDTGNRTLFAGYLICDTSSFANPARLGFVGLLDEEGTYDTTFSNDGIMTFNFAAPGNFNRTLIEDMYVLDNGDILCTGSRLATPNSTKSEVLLFSMNFERTYATLNTRSDQTQNSNIQVYPNPASEYIKINDSGHPDVVNLIDSRGRIILSYENIPNQIPVSALRNGVYFIQIMENGKTTYAKFIKN